MKSQQQRKQHAKNQATFEIPESTQKTTCTCLSTTNKQTPNNKQEQTTTTNKQQTTHNTQQTTNNKQQTTLFHTFSRMSLRVSVADPYD